jgi:multidrug resistance efflux pump
MDRIRAEVIRARATVTDRLAAHGFKTDLETMLREYVAGSHVQVDQAVADVLALEAGLQEEQARLDLLELKRYEIQSRLDRITHLSEQIRITETRRQRQRIVAPAPGIVLTDRIERRKGALVREGDVLLELSSEQQWQAHFSVREQDIHKVKVNDPVKIELQAFREDDRVIVAGIISSLSAEPLRSGQEAETGSGRGYRVTASLDKYEVSQIGSAVLKPGYTVDGRLSPTTDTILGHALRYIRRRIGY